MELLPTLIGINTIYQKKNTDSILTNIASCKTSNNLLLVVGYIIWLDTIIKLQTQEPDINV